MHSCILPFLTQLITVWKSKNFSCTQILRQINFSWLLWPKNSFVIVFDVFNLISHKIYVVENFLNFHTVLIWSAISLSHKNWLHMWSTHHGIKGKGNWPYLEMEWKVQLDNLPIIILFSIQILKGQHKLHSVPGFHLG